MAPIAAHNTANNGLTRTSQEENINQKFLVFIFKLNQLLVKRQM